MSVKVQQAYTDWSATYDQDQNLTRDLDEIVMRQTFKDLRCNSILEIGCGTGKNTSLLAEVGETVLALDFSEGMIEEARRKISCSKVTFEVADITASWPCEDESFDLISCNLVLEHIEDLPHIFAEAARVLAPSGEFFVCELHPYRQYQGTQARFQRAHVTTQIPAFVHHLSDFIGAAASHQLKLEAVNEWWHVEDQHKPPRLISLVFKKW
jgi:ubiquinone/menaquinone biosynthesis C-methylase UbiE